MPFKTLSDGEAIVLREPSGPGTHMGAETALDIYTFLTSHGVETWVDGGWGVDALLERQTRSHGDLDIVVQAGDLPRLTELLAQRGFSKKGEEGARPWNYVTADGLGHEVDIHAIVLDPKGNGAYGPPENDESYPASALTGTGKILGRSVRCIAAQDAVRFHTGYEAREVDYHDVSALCRRFGIQMPDTYGGHHE